MITGVGHRLPALAVLALLMALSTGGGRAAAQGVARPPTTVGREMDAIDAYVETQRRLARVPGLALAIVEGQRVLHVRGYGVADSGGRPVTAETPFRIASLTKSFTALAAMQLVELGRLDLDSPVRRYLPWFRVADPDASAHMTVRHLLDQTSGISTQSGNETLWLQGTAQEKARALGAVRLTAPVGALHQYSNVNYIVAGLVVEAASGRSWEVYLQEHVFVPLQMGRSFASPGEARRQGAATGHTFWFGFPVEADRPLPNAYGSDGLYASAEDLAHFLIAHLNGGRYADTSVLSPQGTTALWQRPSAAAGSGATFYGLGWEVSAADTGITASHGGDDGRFHATMKLFPASGRGLALLANGAHGPLVSLRVDGIAAGVEALLEGREPAAAETSAFLLGGYLTVMAAALGNVAGLVRAIWAPRRPGRPRGPQRLVGALVLLAAQGGLAWFLLVATLGRFGLPVPLALYLMPDFAWGMVVAAAAGVGWGLLRTLAEALVLAISRRGRCPISRAGATLAA
jgi:CubicO group peptidase (beta-lactamase class C family)